MMESLIKDHIMNYLTRYNLISPYQFGFTPGRSCTTQLLHVLDYLTKHLDNGYSIEMIYLDFRKAFDSVPHQCLIHKLSSVGLQGNILKWIKSFLTNRTQQVVLNGRKSSTVPVTSVLLLPLPLLKTDYQLITLYNSTDFIAIQL